MSKRVAGFSVSGSDVVAVAGAVVGALVAVAGAPVGQLVFVPTQSLWLGVLVTILVMLGGFTMVVAGVSYVLSASRSYRFPSDESDGVELERVR